MMSCNSNQVINAADKCHNVLYYLDTGRKRLQCSKSNVGELDARLEYYCFVVDSTLESQFNFLNWKQESCMHTNNTLWALVL